MKYPPIFYFGTKTQKFLGDLKHFSRCSEYPRQHEEKDVRYLHNNSDIQRRHPRLEFLLLDGYPDLLLDNPSAHH